jgi:hypothetical protein
MKVLSRLIHEPPSLVASYIGHGSPSWAVSLVAGRGGPGRGLTLGSSRPPELGGKLLFAGRLTIRVHPAAAEPWPLGVAP